MGGAAPEVDGRATSGLTTGNGSSSTPYDYSDSVLELSPGLARTQYFAPSTWSSNNSQRPGPRVDRAGAALERDLAAGRQVRDRLLGEPASLGGISGRHRLPSVPAAATPTAGTPSRDRRLRAVRAAGSRRCRPARSACCGRRHPAPRPADQRRRAGVVDRRVSLYGLNPANGARSSSSRSAARRTTSRPRRSATGSCWRRRTIRSPPSPARPVFRARPSPPPAAPPNRRIGSSPPTAASSLSATQASTARPAASR